MAKRTKRTTTKKKKKKSPPVRLADARLAVLDQFSYSLVHELRTSLTVIRMSMEFVRGAAASTPQIAEALGMIDEAVNEANQILTDLIEITHPSELQVSAANLETLVSEIIASVDSSRRIAWHLDFPDSPPVVWCDRRRFRQVIENLLRNSVMATNGQGEVHIRHRKGPRCDIVEVRDNGGGVAKEVRATLFEPFVTTRKTGMGLGLTYCRAIVERHGGTIELLDSEGRGAAFQIQLPRQTDAKS